jgi:hypothetical protein
MNNGWPEVFRTQILPILPIDEAGKLYCPDNGRLPRLPVTMTGLFCIQEMFDMDNIEALQALLYNSMVHNAPLIPSRRDEDVYICPKTYYNFRRRIEENDLTGVIFNTVTMEIIRRDGVKFDRQRLDSTHIIGNAARCSRLGLLSGVTARFLAALRRTDADIFAVLPSEPIARYTRSAENGDYFGQVKPSGRQKALEIVANDMLWLKDKFESIPGVSRLEEFGIMARVLDEQCAVVAEGTGEADQTMTARMKDPKDVPCSSVQFPSDPDAAYSGHKGKGYQVQMAETVTAPGEEGPRVVTVVKVETAARAGLRRRYPSD